MKTAWKSLATRLLVVGVLLALVSSPFAAHGQWEADWTPYDGTDSESDPNGNGGPDILDAEGDGDGSGGMGAGWVEVLGNIDIKVSVDVVCNSPGSASAGASGSGYCGGYGSLQWTGEPGEAGNKTCYFYTSTTGRAEGETDANPYTENDYASAGAQSLGAAVALGDGNDSSTYAGCAGQATFWETSTSIPSLNGQCQGSLGYSYGTSSGSASGPETWDNEYDREEGTWSVSAYGYQYDITGGTLHCQAHANASAQANALVSAVYAGGADAYGRGRASAYASIDVY